MNGVALARWQGVALGELVQIRRHLLGLLALAKPLVLATSLVNVHMDVLVFTMVVRRGGSGGSCGSSDQSDYCCDEEWKHDNFLSVVW